MTFKELNIGDRFMFKTLAGWGHECKKISPRRYESIENLHPEGGTLKLTVATIKVPVAPLSLNFGV